MRAAKSLFLFAVAVCFALPGAAQKLPEGFKKGPSVEGITQYDLPNGMRLLLFPDPSKPKITVNMTYMVGSRHENYGETGMAHLLEHLLFKSTPTRPDIKKELSDHGAQFNGSTWYDRTNYYEVVTASDENLKWALDLEADRMLNARMEKSILDTEMTVVRNEFEMGETSPIRVLEERMPSIAFDWHNYGKSAIGARTDIEHVPIDRLAAFYHTYYQPDTAILTIAGRFDEAKTLEWVNERFAKIPRPTRELRKTYTRDPVQDGERSVTIRRVADLQAVAVLYKGPAAAHPDSAALDVLSRIVGEAPSGRLYKALVDSKKAASVGMFSESLNEPGFMMAIATLRKEQSLDDVKNITLSTLAGLISEPPTKEEVERAKTRILKNFDLNLNDSEQVGVVISESAAAGDWRLLFLGRDQIKKVTPEDVLRVAKHYLKESNRTIGTFIPTASPDRTEIPNTPDINALLKDYKGGEAVAQGEAFDPSPAAIEGRVIRSELPNGMKLILLPKKTRGNTVVAYMAARFGDDKTLFGKVAIGRFTGQMLMRGTSKRSRQQIQDELDRLKARAGIAGVVNGATASIETVSANLPGALRLAAEVLRDPGFPDIELDKIRQTSIAAIEAGKSEPQSQAGNALMRQLSVGYPRGDVRYTETPDEQIEDLKKVTIEDVKAFYKQFYGGSNGELVIAGDFDPQEIQKLAAELFGDWKSPSKFERIVDTYRASDAKNLNLETPDKQNAILYGGTLLKMNDSDPDYPAMVLANYLFGGSSASRVYKRLRDKEGFSYGTGTQFTAPSKGDRARWIAFAMYAPDKGPKLEAALKEELTSALTTGFSAEEIATAKKAWQQEVKVDRTQDAGIVRVLSSRALNGRTMMWDQAFEDKVMALTAEQVNAAFKRHLNPSNVSLFKAGDFRKAGVFQN